MKAGGKKCKTKYFEQIGKVWWRFLYVINLKYVSPWCYYYVNDLKQKQVSNIDHSCTLFIFYYRVGMITCFPFGHWAFENGRHDLINISLQTHIFRNKKLHFKLPSPVCPQILSDWRKQARRSVLPQTRLGPGFCRSFQLYIPCLQFKTKTKQIQTFNVHV